ncbi:hypothetical protein HK096_004248, partial [Nowakowskiella sp. JEL0078]
MKIRDLLNENNATSDYFTNRFSNFALSEQLDLCLPVSAGQSNYTQTSVLSQQHFASDSSQFRSSPSSAASLFQNYSKNFTCDNLDLDHYNRVGSFQYKQLSHDLLEPVARKIPMPVTPYQNFEPYSNYFKGPQDCGTPEHNKASFNHWFATIPSEPIKEYVNDGRFNSLQNSADFLSNLNEDNSSPHTTTSTTHKSAPTAKLFKCSHPGCDESFTRRQNLRSHQGRHTGIRDFKCTENGCGSAFHRRQELLRHTRSVHSPKDQRPFMCTSGCSRTFARADALKRHLESTKSKLGGCAAIAAARVLSVH